MHQRHLCIGITICFFAASVFPVSSVKAEIATVAKEQIALMPEDTDRATLAAVIAEKQAEQAGQKSTFAHRAELERELSVLKARETTHGLVLTLGDVLFAPNQSEPTPAAMRKLTPIVTLLKDQPQRSIRIEGYTDSKGTEAYNLDLSQRRAAAIRDFLIDNGIAPQRITARGYGEAISVASNTTSAGRRENRRVEVIVPR